MTRSNEATPNQDSAGSRVHWPSWIVGATILAAVVGVGMHISEGREFLVHAEQAAPWWLLLALILQASTYLAQGEVFRGARRAAGCKVPLGAVYELSLAKLFVDQALPSAGISSTVLVAKALERRAVPRGVVAASMVINIASYHAAYVVCLLIALAITVLRGQTNPLVLFVSVIFVAFSIALIAGLLVVSGPAVPHLGAKLRRFPVLKNVWRS